jgi:hypothetical protein
MPALNRAGVGESHMRQVFADLCGEIAGVFSRHMEAYAKVSLKKYKPMAARNEDKNVPSGLL